MYLFYRSIDKKEATLGFLPFFTVFPFEKLESENLDSK